MKANVENKPKKVLGLLVILLSVTVIFTSCTTKKPYEFMHDNSEFEKVELVDFGYLVEWSNINAVIRASYPIEDINAFLSDFKAVDCEWGYLEGGYFDNSRAIKFVYSNGDYEFIRYDDVVSLLASGEFADKHNLWWFDDIQFNELLEKYSPPRDSGEITEYSFMYPETEIVKIELVDAGFHYYGGFPISEEATYPIEDTEAFLSDFRDVECRTGGWAKWDELRDSESRMIKISYAYGEYEYIGVDGYLQHRYDYTIDQTHNYLSGPDCKCFNVEQFSALIEKYSP